MKSIQNVAIATVLATSSTWCQTAVGTLQGYVIAEDGTPLANAGVLYHRSVKRIVVGNRYQVPPGEAIVNATVSANAGGTFNIGNLPPGEYGLCAHVPGAPYLDPCKWSTAAVANITAGNVMQQNLALSKGVFLNIHVSDPSLLLPPIPAGPFAQPGLIVGVIFGNGAYLAATNTGAVQFGRDYQVPVPAGTPLKLWVFSRHVTLTDSAGSSLAGTGAMIPFTATAGIDQVFTFNVSGAAAKLP
jgi:hypothetical protein